MEKLLKKNKLLQNFVSNLQDGHCIDFLLPRLYKKHIKKDYDSFSRIGGA